MKKNDFPQLYIASASEARGQQAVYYKTIIAQFFLLFIASTVTVSNSIISTKTASTIYLFCIVSSLVIALYSVIKKPEKRWYENRALAESAKSLTWRFIMGAKPFDFQKEEKDIELMFIKLLSKIFQSHKYTNKAANENVIRDSLITEEMKHVRFSTFGNKKDIYLHSRIENQLNWYQNKAKFNKHKSIFFSSCSVGIYVVAIVIAYCQYQNQSFPFQWLSEPILVLAASIIGWMQAKRYSSLASSYNLTFREISKINNIIVSIEKGQFGEFVNESETAFSREHIQWVARQR